MTAINEVPGKGSQVRDSGIVRLNRQSARMIRIMALAIMVIPALGFAEALRLVWTGMISGADLAVFAVMYFIHMAGISMGFHRMLAHRAFKAGRVFRTLLLIAGSMAGQGPVLYWVATHRRHHAYSDREGDPHSPNLAGEDRWSRLRGLWHAHMPWMLSDRVSSWSRFARDQMTDRQTLFFNNTYFVWLLLGLALPALAGYWIHGGWMGTWIGFVTGGLARMFIANQFAWCVGSVCHRFGSQPFNNRDHSTNSWWVAVFTFGEGLQNNHHAFPGSYRHGVKWSEPDLSGWILHGLGKLDVVDGLRAPDPAAHNRAPEESGAADTQ